MTTSTHKTMTKQQIDECDFINFSFNWNNKLTGYAFTTLRLTNEKKYQNGKSYRILLKNKCIGVAEIITQKKIMKADLNEYIARLDTGYSLEQYHRILEKMYPNVNFKNQSLSLILLSYRHKEDAPKG